MRLKMHDKGKVRDIFELDSKALLMVCSDRISVFDVILQDCIPDKGKILNELSAFFMAKTAHIVPNHLFTEYHPEYDLKQIIGITDDPTLYDRCTVVRRLNPIRVEFVVRGYIAGTAWKAYKKGESMCDVSLPPGLVEFGPVGLPIFTPTTKAVVGTHDINLTFNEYLDSINRAFLDFGYGKNKIEEIALHLETLALNIYTAAYEYALTKGIIIADTKLEFGIDDEGEIYLIDEALTPDSSRFWVKEGYKPGHQPLSLDKQYVRDYMDSIGWNRVGTPPKLPADVITNTANKYKEIRDILMTGE